MLIENRKDGLKTLALFRKASFKFELNLKMLIKLFNKFFNFFKPQQWFDTDFSSKCRLSII